MGRSADARGQFFNGFRQRLLFSDGLQSELILIWKHGVDFADLEELDVSYRFVEAKLLPIAVALP